MKLKVCGMKFPENISEIESLNPDFMGFIFYKKSKRFFNESIIVLNDNINRVGVFVNQEINEVIDNVKKHKLDYVQLHGNEDVRYCLSIKSICKVIKVFKIDDNFNFDEIKSIKMRIKEGINPKRQLLLCLIDSREIPLTGIEQPVSLNVIEEEAITIAKYLNVSLETE